MKKLFACLIVLGVIVGAGVASAAELMPNFATVPTGWYTDRYAPQSFTNVGFFEGRNNVLGIGITSAGGFTARPAAYQSTFYNTQGMGYTISGGAGSTISAELYIPSSWGITADGSVRTDMWGVLTDVSSTVSGYPIIGFTNYGGFTGYRVWDDTNGVWIDLAKTVKYNAWTAFSIEFTGSSYEFFINHQLVYTNTSVNGSTGFSEVIMQAYNFYGDPSLTGAVPVDYTAHWANTPVPIPGGLWLLGSGLVGLAGLRRRFKK